MWTEGSIWNIARHCYSKTLLFFLEKIPMVIQISFKVPTMISIIRIRTETVKRLNSEITLNVST